MDDFIVPPPSRTWRRTSATLPVETWAELDKAVKEINKDRDSPERLSRDQLMALCIDWALKARVRRKKGD